MKKLAIFLFLFFVLFISNELKANSPNSLKSNIVVSNHQLVDSTQKNAPKLNFWQRLILRKLTKKQKRITAIPDTRILEPYSVLSAILGLVAVVIAITGLRSLLASLITAGIILGVITFALGNVGVYRVKRNKKIFKGKFWGMVGIALGFSFAIYVALYVIYYLILLISV